MTAVVKIPTLFPFLHKNVGLQNIAICYSLPLHMARHCIPQSCGIRHSVVQVKWAFEQKSLQCGLSAHPASTQHYHIWQPICFLKPSDVVVSEFAYNSLSRWGKCVYYSVSDTAGSLSEGNLLEAMLDVKKVDSNLDGYYALDGVKASKSQKVAGWFWYICTCSAS